MKLINYKRGYNNTFECSIHGTIYMTYHEWSKADKFLMRKIKALNEFGLTAYAGALDIYHKDVCKQINTIDGFIINIRVTATELLASHYKLNNYKRGNYQIYVSNARA